jgi:hypothetical protein
MKSRATSKRKFINDDKIVISSEYYKNDRPSFICSICNQTLVRLTDAGMNNTSWWCRQCSIEWDPDTENLRKESKITVPDRNQEAAITSIQTDPSKEVEIRHTVPLRCGFEALSKKGLRFTSYSTTEKE